MLFQSMSKIKRNTMINAIALVALGVVMLLCPEPYIRSLISLLGYVMIIVGLVMVMDYFSGKKTLMSSILFTIALVLCIVGICVLLYRDNVLRVLGLLFGVFICLDGLRSLFYSYFYVRRSKRKGWQALVCLSVFSLIFGILLIADPFWHTPPELMTVGGVMVVYSGLLGALRMLWIWPIRG